MGCQASSSFLPSDFTTPTLSTESSSNNSITHNKNTSNNNYYSSSSNNKGGLLITPIIYNPNLKYGGRFAGDYLKDTPNFKFHFDSLINQMSGL